MKFEKIIRVFLLITLLFNNVVPLNLYATQVNQMEQAVVSSNVSQCIYTSLTTSSETVNEETQIKIYFNYESKDPVCDPSAIAGEQVQIDFSQIVDSGVYISVSYDNDIFEVTIDENGIATITFKDLSSEGETLVGFGGNIEFTVTVKSVIEDETVTITDSEGNEIEVNIDANDDYDSNSNKYSVQDFVEVCDIVDYRIEINRNHETVENFKLVDSPSAGLEYVPGSLYILEVGTWKDVTDLFTAEINSEGKGQLTRNDTFDESYMVYYQMEITEQHETYKNTATVTYDGTTEYVNDYIEFDMGGGSWIDYYNGFMELKKVNQDKNSLANAEFTITDESGTEVEVLTTNEKGYAKSSQLPLGTYTVTETKAPEGFVNTNFTEVEVITTGENGHAESSELPLGTYTVTETKSPEGYINDNYSEEVEITEDGQMVALNGGNGIVNESNPEKPEKPVDPVDPVDPLDPEKPTTPEEGGDLENTGNTFNFTLLLLFVVVLVGLIVAKKRIK